MNNSASFAPFFTLRYGNESLARHNLFVDVFVGFCSGLAEFEVLDVSQLLFLSVLGRFFSCTPSFWFSQLDLALLVYFCGENESSIRDLGPLEFS